MKKDLKSSVLIMTADTISNGFESNYTCCVITLFSKFEFRIVEGKVFFLIRNRRQVAKLYVIKDHRTSF